jgi:hypothetical protein
MLALALMATLSGPAARAQAATDEHPPAPVEGRWTDSATGLTLDISRCGTRYCGQHVLHGKCSGTVLHLDPEPAGDRPLLMALTGKLDIPDNVSMPRAKVTVSGQGDNLRLVITGVVGGLSPLTRSLTKRIELAPAGRAACPAGATS